MATLPRQYTPYASVARDTQLRTVLETSDRDTFGVGFISGGLVSKVSGYGVKLASGTVLRVEGVTATLAADLNFTMPHAAATEYLWATITRTQATGASSDVTSLDTYAVALTSTTANTAPSAQHALAAIITEDGSGVVSINSAPAGKVLKVARKLATSKLTIAAGEVANIPADEQLVVSTLTILGELQIDGLLLILG